MHVRALLLPAGLAVALAGCGGTVGHEPMPPAGLSGSTASARTCAEFARLSDPHQEQLAAVYIDAVDAGAEPGALATRMASACAQAPHDDVAGMAADVLRRGGGPRSGVPVVQ